MIASLETRRKGDRIQVVVDGRVELDQPADLADLIWAAAYAGTRATAPPPNERRRALTVKALFLAKLVRAEGATAETAILHALMSAPTLPDVSAAAADVADAVTANLIRAAWAMWGALCAE